MENAQLLKPTFKKEKNKFKTLLNEKLHSFDDNPSFIDFTRNEKKWHFEDRLHRDNDLPAVVKHWKQNYNTEIYEKSWYKNGKAHRDRDKPAQILIEKTFFTNGNLRSFELTKKWFRDGKYHRDTNKPSLITIVKYYNHEGVGTNSSFSKNYYVNGLLHRISDAPAKYSTTHSAPNSEKSLTKSFYKEGVLHRDGDKPAFERIIYDIAENNKKIKKHHQKEYINNNSLHRDGDKPAITYWSKKYNSHEVQENSYYYIEGKRHRDGDKPAVIIGDNSDEQILIYFKNNNAHRLRNKPAFVVNQFSDEGNKKYFAFYQNGIHLADDKNLIHNYIINYLCSKKKIYVKSEIEEYPLSQLISIIKTLDNIDYIYDVPYDFLSNINQMFRPSV